MALIHFNCQVTFENKTKKVAWALLKSLLQSFVLLNLYRPHRDVLPSRRLRWGYYLASGVAQTSPGIRWQPLPARYISSLLCLLALHRVKPVLSLHPHSVGFFCPSADHERTRLALPYLCFLGSTKALERG